MGKRGPRPQPTLLKIARGNPGKRKINKKEPHPSGDVWPPSYLSGKSLEKWQELAPGLVETGVLTCADTEALGRYCVLWEQFQKYLVEVQAGRDVLVIKDESGNVKYMQSTPAAVMMMKLQTALLRIEQEYGLTPSARGNIVGKKETEEDPAKKWLSS